LIVRSFDYKKGKSIMMSRARYLMFLLLMAATASLLTVRPAIAASGTLLEQDSAAALQALYAQTPAAKSLGEKAKGILVFPNIVKAGFVIGGQGGDGVLFENGKVTGVYNTAAVSVGLQAGVQNFGYALFFITDSALKNLKTSAGFELGVGPSIVFVDAGMAKALTTMTLQSDIYAFIFNQKGLMAGVGLQGSKVTRLSP
jgi:lipid-binding SYLF domain-containing protein